MKFFFLLAVLFATLISGCNHETKEQEHTIEEALINSDVAGNVFYKVEYDNDAIAFSKKNNELGIIHFSKEDDGWGYRGHSSFVDESEAEEVVPLTFLESSRLKNSDKRHYVRALFGKVNDPTIKKVFLITNDEKSEATLIHSGEELFWYYVFEEIDREVPLDSIRAYNEKDILVHEVLLTY